MAGVTFSPLARSQFAAIAQMRWRLLINSLGRRGGKVELAAGAAVRIFFAALGIGPAIGSGFGAYFAISEGHPQLLLLLLWGIFVIWQLIAINTAAAAEPFDIASLLVYPLSFRSYLLVRLLFGLLDVPTLMGSFALLGVAIGIGIANNLLFPWAALVLLVFTATNLFFTRMIFAWLERWLAQRKTRELVTGLFVVLSLGFQLIGPIMRGRYHKPIAAVAAVSHMLTPIAAALPPSLAAQTILKIGQHRLANAAITFAGLAVYCMGFLAVFALRIRAEYHGENLNETAMPAKAKPYLTSRSPLPGWSAGFFKGPIAASLDKELRYLRRTGPLLYNFITPAFMVFLISGRGGGAVSPLFVFPIGVAYALLVTANFIYNEFGAEGPGVQFYFMAPLRIRDVLVGKNLALAVLLGLEVALVWLVVAALKRAPSLEITLATLCWLPFATLVNMAMGNLRSIYSPKKYQTGKVRQQGASRVNALISFAALLVTTGVGAAVLWMSRRTGSLWWATLIFLLLTAAAGFAYEGVLRRVDGLALAKRELLMETLCRA